MNKIKIEGDEVHIEFDSTVKGQVSAVHLFDMLLKRELAPTCNVCGGITREGQKGRGVQRSARCTCKRGSAGFPCEDCGNVTTGSTRDDKGFQRCNDCGHPSP